MSGRLRILVPALLAIAVIVTGIALGGSLRFEASPAGSQAAGATVLQTTAPVSPTTAPTPTPRPALGETELYGYVPYWQMTDSVATYLQGSPVSTLLLFSVAARGNGALNTSATGYRRITGAIGRRLIADAHRRDARVELVFSSFGADRNGRFFGRFVPLPTGSPGATGAGPAGTPGAAASTLPGGQPSAMPTTPATIGPPSTPGPPPWRRTVDELVALARDLDADGINVDVEKLDAQDRPAYGEFLAALRTALRSTLPGARVTVATEASLRGVGNAEVAARAGVDRLFLMGYDYHWSGSQPGASAPVDRQDGLYTLRWSIDAYVEAGVPRDRIILGLPLYGMQWRTEGLDRESAVIGQGVVWIPGTHADELLKPHFAPFRDEIEQAEYIVRPDAVGYLHTWYDSPGTLRIKLALALDNGLAGAGFWALGYERGLPGYVHLMRDFRDGRIGREEAPRRP